jgi:hypothetical protein
MMKSRSIELIEDSGDQLTTVALTLFTRFAAAQVTDGFAPSEVAGKGMFEEAITDLYYIEPRLANLSHYHLWYTGQVLKGLLRRI